MSPNHKKSLSRSLAVWVAAGIVLAASAVPAPVRADDTEVFFPPATTSGSSSVNPNILFVIDTSGSMGDDDGFTDASGNPLSRLKRVQIAFRQIVNEFGSNVNIGLERFSNEQGGPILFPIKSIDSSAFGGVIKLNYIEQGGCVNEAEQNITSGSATRCSGVSTSYSLRLATDYDKIYQQGDFRDEAEEWSAGNFSLLSASTTNRLTDAAATGSGTGANGRCSDDLDFTFERNNFINNLFGDFLVNTCQGTNLTLVNSLLALIGAGAALPGEQSIGIRFPSVDVPVSASTSIRYASLTVTDNGRNSGQTPTINVFGEKSNSSAQFTGGKGNSDVTTNRPLTTTRYVWNPLAGNLDDPFYTATPVPSTSPPAFNNSAVGSNLKEVIQEIINYKAGLPNTTSPAKTGTAAQCATGNVYGPACYPITLIAKGPNNNARSSYGIYNGTAGGTAVNKRPKLAIVYDGGSYNKLMTGVRFQNVRIPRGAVVTKASIEFHNAETVDDRSLTLSIKGENAGNSVVFAPPATDDLRNRSQTSASVNWATSASGSPGTPSAAWTIPYGSYSTPDIATVVNEVTARTDWCGGNAMTFLFSYVSGDAGRNAVSANVNPAYAPVLHLEIDTSQAAYGTGCVLGGNSVQIKSSSDDAQEIISDGSMATGGTVLSLGCTAVSKCGKKGTYVGVRFPNVKIPQGAQITSATIQFTASDDDSGTAPALVIRGQKTTNAAAFSNSDDNISNRRSSSTSATVNWSPTAWSGGTAYDSPDVTTVLQELVNQTGWSENSAPVFVVDGANVNARRRAQSYDGSAGSAPKLTVTYQGMLGGNTTTTVRQYLPDLVDSFVPYGWTPTIGAMVEASRYFKGETAYYGRTRGSGYTIGDKRGEPQSGSKNLDVSSDLAMISGTTPHALPAGCTTANYRDDACAGETWTQDPVYYQSPILDGCQNNNIVLLSDGYPNQAGVSDGITTARAQVASIIGKSCNTYRDSSGNSQPDWTCGPDIASYLNTTDLIPSSASANGSYLGLTGKQTVSTYTIGFGADVAVGGGDSSGAEFLNKMAQAGGGQFFTAQSSDQLVKVFRSIVSRILDVNTTFVAPAVTVNTFNQLTDRNELYFAVFKPGTNTDWRGNLKRYQIAQPDPNFPPGIYDNSSPPQLAVDASSGFFKAGTTSFWSTTADGEDVAKGGAASVLTTTRNIYTYVGTSPTNVTLSGVASQRVEAANTTLNPADSASSATIVTANQRLGLADTAVNADRTAVLNWADGLDVNDDNGNGSFTDARTQLGDPLHSEPVLINYGLAADSPAAPAEPIPDLSIFMGTNDGGLHAFNTRDGSEYFSFIPQELLPNLAQYYGDSATYQTRRYGMDGPLSFWVNDANGNGGILNGGALETGEFAYLYAGMRRGGRNYYALDVSNRAAPKLKFQIMGGIDGTSYVELGQTWSKATKARMRVLSADTTPRDVLIFSGGYDPAVDGQLGGGVQPDSQGRALYVADASTGALIWWAGFDDTTPGNTIHPNLAVPQMIYSVPASPAAVDLDNNGEVDRIYIADAGGRIFRFILGKNASGVSSLFTTGSTNNTSVQFIAQLSGSTAANAHRFYGSPAVSFIAKDTTRPFIAIAIGSGYREHPLTTENEDRFYVIRDPDVVNVADSARTIHDIVNASSVAYVRQSTEGSASSDLYDATANYIDATCSDTDTVCKNNKAAAVAALGTASNSGASKGYYIRLINAAGAMAGEKVLGPAAITNGIAIFSTFEPGSTADATACSAVRGKSRAYYINLIDGTPIQDRDKDGVLEPSDRYDEIKVGGLPPNPVVITPTLDTFTGKLPCIGVVCAPLDVHPWSKFSWRKQEN